MTGVASGDRRVGTGDGVGSAVAVCGVTTGDWKLDPTPVLGPPTDEAKLRAGFEATVA